MSFLKAIQRIVSLQRPAAPPSTASLTEQASQLIDEGNALEDLGDLDAAMRKYEAALALAPTLGRAHLNCGNVLMLRGDLAGAQEAFEAALLYENFYPGAYFNIGNVLRAGGRVDEAMRAYDNAIAQKPDFWDARIARALVLDEMGRFEQSVSAYAEVLAGLPDYAEVRCDMAYVMSRQGRFSEALAEYRRAILNKPDLVKAHLGFGNILKDMGNLDAAIASFNRAVELQPDNSVAVSSLLFASNYRSEQSEAELTELARTYGRLVQGQAHPYCIWGNDADRERVIRIGLVSGDFRAHPVAYFLEGVLAALAAQAPKRLSIHAYAATAADDFITQRLKASCDKWHVVAELSDRSLAELVRRDEIDILIDLSGHTAHNRLSMFAWKPAPVQASWLGYFATTGLTEIDYLIADPWSLPESEEQYFVEKVWRLPETRLCFTRPDDEVDVSDLPALHNGHVTFGCFNHIAKMNDAVVAVWAQIMQLIPESRLFLKSPPLGEEEVRASTLQRFARYGIDPARVLTEGLSSRKAYLDAYSRVDIALDPFPYPGGTTSVEALWMGVPVLAMAGKRFLSRQGSGLLTSLGLTDWVADDEAHYVRIAVERANNLGELSSLRRDLRARVLASPLLDAARFADHLTYALREMWRRWCLHRP